MIALSIEQMKHLEELGLDTKDASMCWVIEHNDYYLDLSDEYDLTHNFVIPAYTIQDILNHFHHYDLHRIDGTKYRLHSFINGLVEHSVSGHSELEVAYKMLLWYIENGYVSK